MTTADDDHRTRSRRGEGHLLRDDIVEQTASMLRTVDDARDISVRAIADAIGRTVPALYRHFGDRDEIIIAAALHELDAMGIAVGESVARIDDLDVRLRQRAAGYVEFARSHPAAYRALFMAPSDSPNVPGSIEDLMQTTGFDGLIADIVDAQGLGLMTSDVPASSIALQLWTVVHGIASLLIAHPDLDWPGDLLDRTLDMNARGLLPR